MISLDGLQVVEYQSQRVLTTQQLAQVYETETNNIKNNFARNKERFIEGRDYHLAQGEELKVFKNQVTNSDLVDKHTTSLYLWTQRGANRHSKILDTDQAWKQFDLLEETYFQVKTGQVPQMSQLEIIAQIAQQAVIQEKQLNVLTQKIDKHSKEIEKVSNRVNNLDACNIEGNLQQRLVKMVQKYAHDKGVTYSTAWKTFRTNFNTAFSTNIIALLNNYKDKHSVKNLTVPSYLSIVGKLEDAIRVADKMINGIAEV